MKTTLAIVCIGILGLAFFESIPPKKYPPKEVLKQREEMILKEVIIDNMINYIDYSLKIDSIKIKKIKR